MSENHQVLFRKYRPQVFKDVIYQDLAVGALQNAFKQKKIGHAYIFFGPRGVGKTSIARILAKRLNCKSPIENEPCNECLSCTEITRGNSQDVLEIDAASHRGIEHIRELRENVKFTPMSGKYRVYIIDEVHMLTEPAFNALLKTLEEPPAHVVFILATTEFHKIPETILSRCQDFIFKKVPQPVLQSHVEKICNKEGIEFDTEGLFWIARKGDGSVRDTLSFMEQAVIFTDSKLTGKNIRDMIGYHGVDVFAEFVKNILNPSEQNKIFHKLEKLFDEGQDLYKFLWDLLEFVNAIVMIHHNLLDKENSNIPPEDIDKIKKDFREIDPNHINLLAEKLFFIYEKISMMRLRNSQEIKIFLEIQFRKLLFDMDKPTVSGLLKKISDLSRQVQGEISHIPNDPQSLNTSSFQAESLPKATGSLESREKSQKISDENSLDNKATVQNRNDGRTDAQVLGDKMENFVKENFSGTEVDPSTLPDI
ncbi:DNA polymerase III subunit gamma/tau [Leptospira sp. GIMC2001]|uniref:DNA polymerase III subunit gamma/tau n=1 Tax=Leptospira sp. GIMC2001 TaxID=1513297 RepID=UPI0004A5C31D|nr:DNA polymerase III subunit gamma/tau [Leptospira sp. GIMC2001]AID56276.1 DNA polymerase III subunits gamma and tau [Leptospira sp. GIMC2001]WCL49503.1 DNA polymerase III subunit gamma/tau [Leptospira sp. GIMC2001]